MSLSSMDFNVPAMRHISYTEYETYKGRISLWPLACKEATQL